jgi:glycosyltransferase involved in cell wall biosynthesis
MADPKTGALPGPQRILIDHQSPFLLAHGGFQIQIEQTYAALRAIGVEVEFLRWWDAQTKPAIIHFFGRPATAYVHYAQQKGIRVVAEPLLTGLGSRARALIGIQRHFIRTLEKVAPRLLVERFGWEAFRRADACLANTPWEAHLMSYVFGAAPSRVHVLPNGVEGVFLESKPAERGQWLVCTATIASRKRVLELAQAAQLAKTPLWILGKPYAETDPYARAFLDCTSKNPEFVRYEGPIRDRHRLAEIYRQARGFVLLSTMETRSLAAEEAAACECPLLLSDLPWARSVFGTAARYCPVTSPAKTAPFLRAFYDAAPGLTPPPKPLSWAQVAEQLWAIYATLV